MFRLTLDSLQTLDAIDRHGSFSAAADALHKVPSTVSYTVSRLESLLDVALFHRNGPRVTLTVAGHELLREGRWLLGAAADLEARVQRIATGFETELRIVHDAIVPVEDLIEAVREFEALDCGTRLRLTAETMTGVWEALRESRADLVLAVGDPPAGGGLNCLELGRIRYVFCIAPSHPLADEPEPLAAEALQRYPAIVVADSARVLPARTIGLRPGQRRITVGDLAAKRAFQAAGLGHGFLPRRWVANELRRGELVERAVVEPKPDEHLWLGSHTDAPGRSLQWWRERLAALRPFV